MRVGESGVFFAYFSKNFPCTKTHVRILIKKGYDDYFCRRCFVRSRWCNVIVVVFIVVFFRAPFESLSSSWRWWSR